MSRRDGELPRVVVHAGVEVYAPFCEWCDSDQETQWDRLGTLDALFSGDSLRSSTCGGEGVCKNCHRIIRATPQEMYAAREPERLAERLAELKAAGGAP